MIASQKQYEWKWKNEQEEWSLNLFPDSKESLPLQGILNRTLKSFRKIEVPLPFIEQQKGQNFASHLLRIKTFEPIVFNSEDHHYYDNKSNYRGKIDAELFLIYEGWMDWEYRTEAFFLKGKFKAGRMPTRGGKYTEDINVFKRDLTNYFELAEKSGLPPFGEYVGEFFMNSNLPRETAAYFKELAEQYNSPGRVYRLDDFRNI